MGFPNVSNFPKSLHSPSLKMVSIIDQNICIIILLELRIKLYYLNVLRTDLPSLQLAYNEYQ